MRKKDVLMVLWEHFKNIEYVKTRFSTNNFWMHFNFAIFLIYYNKSYKVFKIYSEQICHIISLHSVLIKGQDPFFFEVL